MTFASLHRAAEMRLNEDRAAVSSIVLICLPTSSTNATFLCRSPRGQKKPCEQSRSNRNERNVTWVPSNGHGCAKPFDIACDGPGFNLQNAQHGFFRLERLTCG